VILSEIIPATAESAAPTANASPFEGCKNAPIITVNAIATGMMILISLFKNAAAPILTAFEISIISFVPAGCFAIHATKPPATKNDAIPAINGSSSEISNIAFRKTV
jgi:hypothetical protein